MIVSRNESSTADAQSSRDDRPCRTDPTVTEPEAGNLYFDDNVSKFNHLIAPVGLENLLYIISRGESHELSVG